MNNLKLTYWTNRWGSTTTLGLEATSEGWVFRANAHSGKTNPEGAPHLLGNLNQDNVYFPSGIHADFAYVWGLIRSGDIDAGRAQDMLDELGGWISATEQAKPRWKGWNC